MANSFERAARYLPLLDEVYKLSALTSVLDTQGVQFVDADTIKVFKLDMDGLGNYDRNKGFVAGSATGTWETMKLTKDRGRSFMVDRMDNEETLDQAFGALAGEFIRTKVTPELDSYRFATMAGASNILKATAADFTDAAAEVVKAVDLATEEMNDNEVPTTGRIMFISENAYRHLKDKIVRSLGNDSTVSRGVETYDNMRIIRVPKARFSTAITLQDGSTGGQTSGGYVQTATTGYPINFMIVHPSAVVSAVKHLLPRIFTPDENQTADAWKFDYRIYHDLFVYENKAKGIYLHAAATANS